MKLFIYQHCPFCVRAQMIFGLKNVPVETAIIMEDDVDTPTRMIGKKMVPILQKDDGSFMPESMDIVHYIDALSGAAVADAPIDEWVQTWASDNSELIYRLVVPRFTHADFAELSTTHARNAYTERETRAFGHLAQLQDQTPQLIAQLTPALKTLDTWLAQHHHTDTNDFILLPLLRSLSIVKGLNFDLETLTYMQRISALAGVDLLFEQAL